jgi:TRAP-type C4-dicarboxylate transport system permease large subunit
MGMGMNGLKNALLETASGVSAILFLLITATMYSRMLTMSGMINWLNDKVTGMDVSPYIILTLFMLIVIFLGCVLDSSSIMLIVVPLMAPLMASLGFDLIWFGVVLVLFVHMGLLTPPFGMCVFAVKASIGDQVSVERIFAASMPFLLIMVAHAVICIILPFLSTWLPSLM